MDADWLKRFEERLDKHYAWPSLYTFKFIVPAEKESELKELFPNHTSSLKASKNGNYVSITYSMMMPSSEAVIKVYKTASAIEGIIAL
jgi:putative lipoic acid-binding regulatory protein